MTEQVTVEKELPMKEHLLSTVKQLQDNGIDLEATPPLFKWSYPEEPNIQFQLLILEGDQREIGFDESLH